jgi:hypothetical protein
LDFSSLDALRRIYATALEERLRGTWAALPTDERLRREATFLETVVDQVGHCESVIRYLRESGIAVAVVIDNVDQRDPADQVKIFLLAHQFCKDLDAIVLVALREESYFRAEQAGAFNAYHNVRYHIASPDARQLLRKRVEFALDVSKAGGDALRVTLRSGVEFDADAIRTFLRILYQSAFKQNPAICQFIDAISQGNMRAALDMFNQFMVSGSTNVEKMLDKYSHGGYMVAEHEFVKAVMLGDFQFYKDLRSPVANLFEVSGSPAASNLTGIRLLHFLDGRSGHAHPEGTGFVPIEDILRLFGEVFGETEDAGFVIARLISKHLLEADNRQVTTLEGVRFVRITRSGKYYLNTLVGRFQYLDLVSLDTPIWDRRVVQELRKRATSVDLYERFERTEWFLNYLKREEERTLATSARNLARRAFSESLVVAIDTSFRQDLSRIAAKAHLSRRRLTEIREAITRDAGNIPLAANA